MTMVQANQRIKTLLPLIVIGLGAVFFYLWLVVVYFRDSEYWTMPVWAKWVLAFITTLIALTTYFVQRLGWKSDEALRGTTRGFTTVLLTCTAATLFLVATPYFASEWAIQMAGGYQDPALYPPFVWGDLGEVLQSFAANYVGTFAYLFVVMCGAVLMVNLSLAGDRFNARERWFHQRALLFCGAFFLLLLRFWPLMIYWIED